MLPATLLILTNQANALDSAMSEASKAMADLSSMQCAYSIKTTTALGTGYTILFDYWRDGDKQRVDVAANGKLQMKGLRNADGVMFIFPGERRFISSKDVSLWDTLTRAKEPESDGWSLSFSSNMRLSLRTNPPFSVTREEVIENESRKVRKIWVVASRTDKSPMLTGTLTFDAVTKHFLGASMELFKDGKSSETHEVRRLGIKTEKPKPNVFNLDPKEVRGYAKFDPKKL